MSVKENPKKDVKCICGKTTTVNVEPATAYSKVTRFICECEKVYHIRDYMNGCITYMIPSKKVDKAYLNQVEGDRKKCDDTKNCLITETPNQKECFNHCPKCDATDPDIIWGDKDWGDTSAWQNATCKKCGCEFTEVYNYFCSEIDAPTK